MRSDVALMPLTLRPIEWPGTGPAYREKYPDYEVRHDRQPIGRIYRQQSAISRATEWFWTINSMTARPDVMQNTGACGSLQEAKAELRANWRKWLASQGASPDGTPPF
jgi:hypothetical protein